MSLANAMQLIEDIESIVNDYDSKVDIPSNDSNSLVMGLDCSTQSLTISIYSTNDFEQYFNVCINFDEVLPKYNTEHGVHKKDNNVVTAPTLMFVEAVDIALKKLDDQKCPFHEIVAISGSGQQHGSVYWAKKSEKRVLQNLDPNETLLHNFSSAFILDDSPLWMDSSTTLQCQKLAMRMKGALNVAKISGCIPNERFTGNQIAKLFENEPEIYDCCERISLISSFLASIFLGKYAPIDVADGSGMNLLNISTREWCPQLLDACAPDLIKRLGESPVESDIILGAISEYFVDRFHFNPECKIVAFSGDNPCSLAGLMCCEPGDICISLGTSDTLYTVITDDAPKPCEIGCVLCSPIHHGYGHMLMLVYKNGSIAREKIRDIVCHQSWNEFSMKLKQNRNIKNKKRFGFYFFQPEISPVYDRQILRFNVNLENGNCVQLQSETDSDFDISDVCGIIESQFLGMRTQIELLGVSNVKRILCTGGASQNTEILQVIADVFASEVYIAHSGPETAAKGAALRALHAFRKCNESNQNLLFSDVCKDVGIKYQKMADCDMKQHEIYNLLMKQYKLLTKLLSKL